MPNRKVSVGVAAGAVMTIAVFIFKRYGVEITGEVAAAGTMLLTFLSSYFVTEPQ